MSLFYVSQSQEEFDGRSANPVHKDLFVVIQGTQGVIIVFTQLGLFLLLARQPGLRTRNLRLLCLQAVPDLLFGIYLLVAVLALRVLRDETVPYGRDACQLCGAWTVGSLLPSLLTYALTAYDRYKAFVTPLHPLSVRGLRHLWLLAVVTSCFCALA